MFDFQNILDLVRSLFESVFAALQELLSSIFGGGTPVV